MSNRNATVTVNTKANTSGIDKATQSLKTMDSGLKGSLGSLKQFKGALGGLAVIGIGKSILDFANKAEDAFKVQWLAEKSINDALYSNMTARGESQKSIDNEVKSYKSLASELQKIGVIGDEVTLGGMGIMTRMGLDPEKVKEMTPLLQDLAVKQYGLNVSSEQFAQTSQALAQMVNMGKLTLGNYGIQVSDVERKQFKAMNQSQRYAFVMNKLKNSVAGTNEEMAKTASGKIIQMNNNIGDATEKIGQLVTQIKSNLAGAFAPVIEEATASFQEFMDIVNGAEAPEGGYQFWSEDDANNLKLIRDNLGGIGDNLASIFNSDYPSLSAFLGTEQFLADLAKITNELNYVSGVIATIKSNWTAVANGDYESVVNPFKGKDEKPNANGTNYWQGGRTLVGEYGPELVDLPRGSSVNTNAQTQRELSGGGTTVNCPININGNVIGNEEFVNYMGQQIASRVSLAIANC